MKLKIEISRTFIFPLLVSLFITVPFNTLSSQWRFFEKKDETAMHELIPEKDWPEWKYRDYYNWRNTALTR
jgi:hypothetical protein